MKKEFRVNIVHPNEPEGLTLLLWATSLNSAVKKLRYSTEFQLPAAQYYVYESGRYTNGVSISLTPAFVEHLHITRREAEIINGYLQAKNEEEFQSENETITHTVVFPDGNEMDIKCCGAQDDCSWTEAVLFNRNGFELCCSEVSNRYDGTWELEYLGRRYIAVVRFHK